jgi:glutathione peroxidase
MSPVCALWSLWQKRCLYADNCLDDNPTDMAITINDITVVDAKGRERSMAEFAGDVLLVVNVASRCGYTPQYDGLQRLQADYKDRGFRVLGFPCNDFGAQEPGTLDEIQQFCDVRFGVTFELFDKVHAKGDDKSPIYARLTQAEPAGDVAWNFEKFLIDRNGRVLQRFKSRVEPLSREVVGAIEDALS